MKKILLGIVVVLAVLVLGVLALAATRPTHYTIQRTATVAAPPSTVHSLVDDLHRFPEWSPWQKLDPAMKVTYDGPQTGVGSKYHWVGNKDAGEGRMTITESTPGQSVVMKLEFIKPFASVATTTLAMAPEGEGSKVTWMMEGDWDYMSKIMGLFMNMDTMIGKDFTEGLANLDRLAQSTAAVDAAAAGAPADSTGAMADTTGTMAN